MHEERLTVETWAGCRTKELSLHLTPGKSMYDPSAPYVVENTSSQTCQDLSAVLTEAPVSTNNNLHIETIYSALSRLSELQVAQHEVEGEVDRAN